MQKLEKNLSLLNLYTFHNLKIMRVNIYSILVFIFILFFTSCVKEDLNDCYYSECSEDEVCVNGECVTFNQEQLAFNSQLRPKKIVVSNFIVKRFPNRLWDPASGPDLIIQIIQGGTNILWQNSTAFQNVTVMPFSVPLTTLLEFLGNYGGISINMYDDDGNLYDQFIGGALGSFYIGNGYPDVVNIDLGGAVGFQFYLRYEF